ncbi:hypothetical protein WDW86_18185 [Bdellovibrionota bacterium FG-2]
MDYSHDFLELLATLQIELSPSELVIAAESFVTSQQRDLLESVRRY